MQEGIMNKKLSFINLEIISLNAAELSPLVPLLGTGKFNFYSHFHII